MAKQKGPAFQFYYLRFLSGVKHFTAEETGAYLLLLIEQWDAGFISMEPKFLKKITGISSKKLQKVVKKFTEVETGKFQNEVLEEIRKDKAEFSLKQKVKVDKRWENLKSKTDTTVYTTELPGNNHSIYPTTTSTIKEKYIKESLIRHKTFSDELKKSEVWIEALCMKLKLIPDQVKKKLDDFPPHLTTTGESHQTISEYQKHFSNWKGLKQPTEKITTTSKPKGFPAEL